MMEIRFSIIIFTLHFFHCVVVFSFMEHWTMTTATYYTFVTLSTIGLGDRVALYYKPGNDASDDPKLGPHRKLRNFGWYHAWYRETRAEIHEDAATPP